MHGCAAGARDRGWGSRAARERSSALAASVASRYALGADGVCGCCAPGRPWQPGHCLALRARSRKRGRCAPGGAYMCFLRTLSPGGEWGCRGRRMLRATREARCKACFELLPRARVGWHTASARGPCCHRLRHAGAERRYGGSWQEGGASGVAAAPRSRAAGAPATRRRRAVGGACACRARVNPSIFKRPAKTKRGKGGEGAAMLQTCTPKSRGATLPVEGREASSSSMRIQPCNGRARVSP